jgi:hypothetical protein
MYDALTMSELCVLQSMLYEGTEDAFRVAHLNRSDPAWFGYYRPVHREVAVLFIDAGTELVARLDAAGADQAA